MPGDYNHKLHPRICILFLSFQPKLAVDLSFDSAGEQLVRPQPALPEAAGGVSLATSTRLIPPAPLRSLTSDTSVGRQATFVRQEMNLPRQPFVREASHRHRLVTSPLSSTQASQLPRAGAAPPLIKSWEESPFHTWFPPTPPEPAAVWHFAAPQLWQRAKCVVYITCPPAYE